MKNTLKAELHQAFHNRFFYISFFLMLAFSVFGVFFMELPRESGFDLWRQYRFDENGAPLTTLFLPATGLYCKWLGGDAGQFTTAAFYFLVFLVCTVPFSWSLVSEKQSGYESHMILSAGKPAYYISKYFASFLSGAFVIIVPLLTNFILSACFVPAFRPEPYADLYYGVPVTYLWSSLYVTHPLLYVLLYILLAGVMAGMWATVGVSLAFLVQNRFVVMILPYLLLLFFHVMWSHFAGSILNLQIQLSPFYFIIPRAIEYTNSGWVILVWIAAILLFDLLVYWRKGICSDVL